MSKTYSLVWFLLGAAGALAQDLKLSPEFRRPDPFGNIVGPDQAGGSGLVTELRLVTGRANHVSCHVVVLDAGTYEVRVDAREGGLSVDVFREWFHKLKGREAYYPDALIPVAAPYAGQLPDADNRIPKQSAQAFWLDIFVPANAAAGSHEVTVTLRADGKTLQRPIHIEVLEARIPDEDALAVDHNTYGTQWLAQFYPALAAKSGEHFFASDAFFRLIHDYYRIFFEHRGVFHQLGYGHGGKVGPEFAPTLQGDGKDRHIASWDMYDRHYGPLLDGSAFAKSKRTARPIPFVYLPVNPEWPASFVNWGEPGYQTEFVNVVSEMEKHFRSKGWTHTNVELFFNHKKRYKAFPWDGDETRFEGDFVYFKEYRRLLDMAVPKDSPVHFVFRSDVSWMMERQFKELAGIINFWVCGGGMLSWYREAVPELKKRGDIVWSYGGTPSVDLPASSIATDLARAWMWGLDGYVRWLTTDPGPDPWFQFGGGDTVLAYPGDRFGISGPIPSVRLKLQRNVAADLALLHSLEPKVGTAEIRARVAKQFNGTTPEEWWTPRPPIADTPPRDWSNDDVDNAPQPNKTKFQKLDPNAWQGVRDLANALARERSR